MHAPGESNQVGSAASHGWAIREAFQLTPLAQSILRERRTEADRDEAESLGRLWRDRSLRAATDGSDR
jgi:hypothetical protein